MTARIPATQLSDATIPQAYRDEIAAAATISGEYLLIDAARLAAIKTKYGRPVKLPPTSRIISNAASAARRITVAALTGQPIAATPEQIADRQTICSTCPDLQNGRCLRCGCYYRTKITLATEKCPIGKW